MPADAFATSDPPDPRLRSARTIYASTRFQLAEEVFALADSAPAATGSPAEITKVVFHHPGAVAVLAQPDTEHVVLVRQYRYALRRWTFEIPAGTRDRVESARATAERELAEETGYAATELHELLRFFPAPGVSDEEMILFRATNLREVAAGPEPGELARRAVVAIRELPAMVRAGMLLDAKTVIALAFLGIGPAQLHGAMQEPASQERGSP